MQKRSAASTCRRGSANKGVGIVIDFPSLSALGARRALPARTQRRFWIGFAASFAIVLMLSEALAAWTPGSDVLMGDLAQITLASVALLVVGTVVVQLVSWRVTEAVPVVVVGDGPLASVVTGALGSQRTFGGRNGTISSITRVAAGQEAETLLRASSNRTVVISALQTNSLSPQGLSGKQLLPASDVVSDFVGRVPLGLVSADAWLHGLGVTLPLPLGHRLFKRTVDLAFVMATGILFVPLLPILAVAIRLESPGPVFYRQTRVGLGNRRFSLIKLRSMRIDAEQMGAKWADESDPRITRIGGLLRRSRMDELPQIWNILRGDMTLIGPRPERPEFTQLLEDSLPCYSKRHSVRPGLTGWAQVRYHYASSIQDSAVKLEHDLYYIKRLSPALDIRILWLTVQVVLGLRGR